MSRSLDDKRAPSLTIIMLYAYPIVRLVNSKRTAPSSTTKDGRDDDEGENESETCTPCKMNWAQLAASRRQILSWWTIAIGTLLLLTLLVSSGIATDNSQHQHTDERHPFLPVETKYWARNMEFDERSNWRNRLRPCTLLEKIAIDHDGAVISLGDAFDNSLGSIRASSISEFVLANNGVLLLEEDTMRREEDYISYVNSLGNCFDSQSLPEQVQDKLWFQFEPSPDELSWFNSANWMSEISEDVVDLVPDSHRIPCTEDVVVFGSRRAASWNFVEANERSPIISFKVNFRPSEHLLAERQANGRAQPKLDSLRVSKLKIGDRSFSQDDFDQLTRMYGNDLFEFNDEKSIFNSLAGNQSDALNSYGQPQRSLIIDESSIQMSTDQELCLDEAGCICGNEQANMMEIICSFNQPLDLSDMPCFDPIHSRGYCNQICAAAVLINIDPTKFSERYLSSMMVKIMTGQNDEIQLPSHDYFTEYIFVGHRRVDFNKYEITLRLLPSNVEIFHDSIGRDLELAELIKRQLEKAAIKSFYGINTIHIKASVLWRRDSSVTIFWSAFIVTLLMSTILLNRYESFLLDMAYSTTLINVFDIFTSNSDNGLSSSYVDVDDHLMSTHQASTHNDGRNKTDNSLEHVLPDRRFAMIELDTRSVTDSTLGLLEE